MAIDRVGQKVVCIAEFAIEDDGGVSDVGCPKADQVYTVSGFADVHHAIRISGGGVFPPGAPGIYLNEVGALRCIHCGGPSPWLMSGFRPVDERKTDISEIVKQALDVKIPETV